MTECPHGRPWWDVRQYPPLRALVRCKIRQHDEARALRMAAQTWADFDFGDIVEPPALGRHLAGTVIASEPDRVLVRVHESRSDRWFSPTELDHL